MMEYSFLMKGASIPFVEKYCIGTNNVCNSLQFVFRHMERYYSNNTLFVIIDGNLIVKNNSLFERYGLSTYIYPNHMNGQMFYMHNIMALNDCAFVKKYGTMHILEYEKYDHNGITPANDLIHIVQQRECIHNHNIGGDSLFIIPYENHISKHIIILLLNGLKDFESDIAILDYDVVMYILKLFVFN